MNSKKCSIRPIGQRSIASTFLFRAANRSSDCTGDVEIKGPREKGSHISFSDFLNRKLHRSSVLPTALEGKEPSLSSPLKDDQSDRVVKGETGKNEGREAESKPLIDGAFDLFKNVKKGKNEITNSYSISEPEIIDVDDLPQTRKRKILFEDHGDNPTARKRVVVLGEDSKPVQSSRKKYSSEEPRPLFNHYKSGVGWWNENMEGIDNEEVGCNDVWEGVGCTTLGGLEWH
ncbi:hypothetical protein ACS0TY_023031 [Phlomoides rotata]